MTSPREMYDQFAAQGYAGPVRVLSAQECQRFLQAVGDPRRRPPLDWNKGHAASSRAFYEISTHPAIIEVVAALLGEDVMLWGASIQSRPPGAVHPWHSDIESSDPSSKTVSVWIGIEHTTRDSSLLIIPYSHRFGVTVQEVRHQLGWRCSAVRASRDRPHPGRGCPAPAGAPVPDASCRPGRRSSNASTAPS